MGADAIAYVDESGCLADPRDRYVALAAVVVRRARQVRKIVRKAARSGKRVSLKKRGGYETKWWNADDHLRKKVLEYLGQSEVDIFWLVVDKEGGVIPDTPENYGVLVCELLEECTEYYPNLELIVDVHFSKPEQQRQFDQWVRSRLGEIHGPFHLDSQQEAVIQLADFVAGAVREWAEGESRFLDLIQERVVVGKVVKWRQLGGKI